MKWLKQKLFFQKKATASCLPHIIKTPLPPKLIFPLIDKQGNVLTPCVEIGQRVLKGQALTLSHSWQQPVLHASTSGRVTEIKEHPVVHSLLDTSPCIIIEPDAQEETITLDNTNQKPEEMLPIALKEKCHQAGIVGLGGAGFPLAQKCVKEKIEVVIINGMECEPPILADEGLMQERAEKICVGATLIQKMVLAEKIIIAVDKEKKEAIKILLVAAKKYTACHIKVLEGGYPCGSERQLIHALTGKEIPREVIPSEEGFLMVNVATAAAVYDAVIEDTPLISRVLTLAGSVFSAPFNIEVLNGTPINWLLNYYGLREEQKKRVVQGGSLMGVEVKDLQAPITKVTNCLWVEPIKEREEEQPCIRCGFCVQVCPQNLLPQQLFWFIQGNDLDKTKAYHLDACIECGACAYVCPSHIPLVEYYKEAKQEIKRASLAQEQALLAKERYEARQKRLARQPTLEHFLPEELSICAQKDSLSLEGNIDKKAAILAAIARRKNQKL